MRASHLEDRLRSAGTTEGGSANTPTGESDLPNNLFIIYELQQKRRNVEKDRLGVAACEWLIQAEQRLLTTMRAEMDKV